MEAAFARAFNARDLTAMTAMLAPEATTELVGSGFPAEQGAGAIREGSFAHLLEGEGLRAARLTFEGSDFVAFHAEDGTLDSLTSLTVDGDAITKLRYHTRWHDEAYVARVADAV